MVAVQRLVISSLKDDEKELGFEPRERDLKTFHPFPAL